MKKRWESSGFSEEVQRLFINKLSNGELPDSMNPKMEGEIVNTTKVEKGNKTVIKEFYPDGSYTIKSITSKKNEKMHNKLAKNKIASPNRGTDACFMWPQNDQIFDDNGFVVMEYDVRWIRQCNDGSITDISNLNVSSFLGSTIVNHFKIKNGGTRSSLSVQFDSYGPFFTTTFGLDAYVVNGELKVYTN